MDCLKFLMSANIRNYDILFSVNSQIQNYGNYICTNWYILVDVNPWSFIGRFKFVNYHRGYSLIEDLMLKYIGIYSDWNVFQIESSNRQTT